MYAVCMCSICYGVSELQLAQGTLIRVQFLGFKSLSQNREYFWDLILSASKILVLILGLACFCLNLL